MEFFMRPEMGAEVIYSFVIIICSLMIYFGTRELYELSSHKGIKYFRQAFLFFALAYFFRSMIMYFLFVFGFKEILDISMLMIGATTLFLFVYFSSMAVFCLLHSVMWKKWKSNSRKTYLFHFIALVIAGLSLIPRSMFLRFAINIILFLVIIFTVYQVYKESKKKKNKLYASYMLLFVFFLLNVFDILIPDFLTQFKVVIYSASTLVFLLILYKVLKKIGN